MSDDALQVQEMEWDKKDLERQLNELKLKLEQAERAAVEQRQVDEKKHGEEIQFLKRTNQQLKVCSLQIERHLPASVRRCRIYVTQNVNEYNQLMSLRRVCLRPSQSSLKYFDIVATLTLIDPATCMTQVKHLMAL